MAKRYLWIIEGHLKDWPPLAKTTLYVDFTFWVSLNLWYEFQRIFLPRAKEDADKFPYYLSVSLGRIFSLALPFSEDLSPGFMPGLNFNSSLYDSPQSCLLFLSGC